MANAIIAANQIKGLVPALDPRNLGAVSVLDGSQNFLVDFKGPYAAFASRIFTYNKFANPGNVQSFRITNNDEVIFTSNAVLLFDWTTQRLSVVYTFADPGTIWPWTQAEVEGIYYFVKSGINGIIKFDPSDNSWDLITNNVPDSPLAVTQAAGRLVIMSKKFVAWSALGDGTNLTPDINSGAGFQSLALIGGDGLAVKEVVDGFLTFTTKGTLKSQITLGNNPFRHFALDRIYRPINQFCIVELESREILILDRRGFFVTLGQQYQDFEPLMSEYFQHTLLPSLDLTNQQIFKIYYDQDSRTVYISLQTGPLPGLYSRAHVFYRPRGEWGLFNASHYAIMEMANLSGPAKGYNLGYLSDDEYFHAFVSDVFNEVAPDFVNLHFYRLYLDRPVRIIDGKYIFSSLLHLTAVNEATLFTTAGMYNIAGNAVSPYLGVTNPLNSIIKIGLFRYSDHQYPDELGLVSSAKLSVDNLPGNPNIEDYMNEAVGTTEDWNNWPVSDVFEDWGLGVLSATLFTATIYGTSDGTNTFQDQEEEMNLSYDEGNDKHYTCLNVGLYHIIELSALEINQTFHLRLIELSGTVAGRL